MIEAPAGQALGAFLGHQLRKASVFPSEHGKLRDFIRNDVPEVCEAGMHGLDVLFKLQTPKTASSLGSGIVCLEVASGIDDPAVWRTFSSPSGLYRLFGNADGRLLVVGPRDLIPTSPWRHIPSCSIANHNTIATSWISQLSEHGDYLRGALLSGCGPTSQFLVAVREKDLAGEWNQFRTTRIRELFESALRDLGIPPDAKRADSVKTVLEAPTILKPEVSDLQHREPNKWRTIILEAVQRMNDDELRKLLIPAGYIADIMDQTRG